MKASKKKPSKTVLVKKLDTVFSKYVRALYSTDGMVECYTCNCTKPIPEMHCGHFMSRRHYATRWEVDNCRPQCVSCNMFNQGQQYIFGKRLEAELGVGRVDQLRELRHEIMKYKTGDYLDMIDSFTSLLDALTTT